MLVVGAKGFAKELLEIIYQNDASSKIVFFDDVSSDLPEMLFDKYLILKSEREAVEYFNEKDKRFALGIGNPQLRYEFYKRFNSIGGNLTTIISPFAQIGKFNNNFGEGVNILTNAVIESNNNIGMGALIHSGSLISHDVTVGDFCEISPKVSLLGNVIVGNFCRLGTGCIVLPKVRIGNQVTIGAGAVVTKNVSDNTTVVGIPAKPLLKTDLYE